jgi:hypothetical protein
LSDRNERPDPRADERRKEAARTDSTNACMEWGSVQL